MFCLESLAWLISWIASHWSEIRRFQSLWESI